MTRVPAYVRRLEEGDFAGFQDLLQERLSRNDDVRTAMAGLFQALHKAYRSRGITTKVMLFPEHRFGGLFSLRQPSNQGLHLIGMVGESSITQLSLSSYLVDTPRFLDYVSAQLARGDTNPAGYRTPAVIDAGIGRPYRKGVLANVESIDALLRERFPSAFRL